MLKTSIISKYLRPSSGNVDEIFCTEFFDAGVSASNISGSSTTTFSHSALLGGKAVLSAASSVTLSQTAVLKGKGKLIATSPLTFSHSAVLSEGVVVLKGYLTGNTTTVFSQSAGILGLGMLHGEIPFIYNVTGRIRDKNSIISSQTINGVITSTALQGAVKPSAITGSYNSSQIIGESTSSSIIGVVEDIRITTEIKA